MVGFRHNATGRSTGRFADKRIRSRLGPPKGEPWVFLTVQMLESPACRSLSINARRALDRLEIEHSAHAGLENGELRVSARQFHEFGVTKDCLTNSIRELESKGFIEVQTGEAEGVLLPPFIFRLTFYGTPDRNATNNWRHWRGEQWPSTPTPGDILDVPKTRDGKSNKRRMGWRQKPRCLSLKVGIGSDEK